MTSNLQDLPSHLAGLRNVKYHYWTDRRLLFTLTRSKGDDMGGVVEDVVGGISDLGASIDDEVLNTDLGKAALLAGGAYLAAPYVMGTGAGALDTLALGDMAATGAGGGLTAGGIGGATGAAAAQAAVNAAGGSTLGNLASSAVDWAKANPLQAAGLGLTAAKALGGSTPSSSTTTSSIDPDVKAAYLQNLADARATAAGLGQRQFAPMSEYNLGMVQRYMNPFEQEVIQGSIADIERARQMQRAQENVQATAARAFGGSRQGVTRSLVDEAALRDVANLTSRLRSQGFTQAQNLGLAQEDLRRQLEQQRLDAARGLGVERLGVSQAALSLQPARIGESTTSPIFRNPAASGLGGALAGGQLGSLIGGKQFGTEYAGYGAGIGGLLGLLG